MRPRLVVLRPMVRYAHLATVMLLLQSCTWLDNPRTFREIGRTPSPDGQLDAVLSEHSGGATTGLYHDVYVVPHGAPVPRWTKYFVARFEWVYRNDSTVWVNFRWRGNDTLALEFLRSSRQRLQRPSLDGPRGPISVVLTPGVADATGRRIVAPRR